MLTKPQLQQYQLQAADLIAKAAIGITDAAVPSNWRCGPQHRHPEVADQPATDEPHLLTDKTIQPT